MGNEEKNQLKVLFQDQAKRDEFMKAKKKTPIKGKDCGFSASTDVFINRDVSY